MGFKKELFGGIYNTSSLLYLKKILKQLKIYQV